MLFFSSNKRYCASHLTILRRNKMNLRRVALMRTGSVLLLAAMSSSITLPPLGADSDNDLRHMLQEATGEGKQALDGGSGGGCPQANEAYQ